MSRAAVVGPILGAAGICVVVALVTSGSFAAWTAAGAYAGSALWAALAMPRGNSEA